MLLQRCKWNRGPTGNVAVGCSTAPLSDCVGGRSCADCANPSGLKMDERKTLLRYKISNGSKKGYTKNIVQML